MSSRFVSAGVVGATGAAESEAKKEKPQDIAADKADKADKAEEAELTARQAEWLAVERRLDEERKKREAARAAAAAPSSSLYDMLQANKDAKQAAFEEAAKLSNQFRALDEDEIEFLDSLKERERAEAERVKRETAEGIEAFRKAQTMGPDAEGATTADAAETAGQDDISWSIRKRKRTGRTGFPNLKRRADDAGPTAAKAADVAQTTEKSEKTEAKDGSKTAAKEDGAKPAEQPDPAKPLEPQAHGQPQPPAKPLAKPKLLVAYGSDSESE